MSSPDALDLLRESIRASRPATLRTAAGEPTDALTSAASLAFPSADAAQPPTVVLKDAPTRYLRSADAGEGDSYTVGQLWLAWTERDTGIRDYLVKGQAAGGFVAITDRRDVVLFLQGASDGGARVVGKGEEAKATAPVVTPAAGTPATEAGPSRAATAAPKRKYEVDVADREFCKRLRAEEVELDDRNTVLRRSGGGKVNNFQSFLQTVMSEKIRALRKSFESGGRVQPQPQHAMAGSGQRKQKAASPIILISSSPTALVTMWNIKKLLEQGIFEPSDVARHNAVQQGNTRAEDVIRIERKRSGPSGDMTSSYYVVDSVEALQKFGAEAWDRVICVITTGQAWQFKPYKWMDPKVLFRNVKGFYFQWQNEPVNPAVREWNVTEMRVDRSKRHTDRQVVAEFWRVLDASRRR